MLIKQVCYWVSTILYDGFFKRFHIVLNHHTMDWGVPPSENPRTEGVRCYQVHGTLSAPSRGIMHRQPVIFSWVQNLK